MKNLTKLNKKELREINGGSEVTDAFWYGVGAVVGTLVNARNRLKGRDSAHGGMSSVADK